MSCGGGVVETEAARKVLSNLANSKGTRGERGEKGGEGGDVIDKI